MAVSADEPGDTLEFSQEQGIAVPLVSDPGLVLIERWGVRMEGGDIAVPTTFIVDGRGVIRWKHVGETMMDLPYADAVLAEARVVARSPRE